MVAWLGTSGAWAQEKTPGSGSTPEDAETEQEDTSGPYQADTSTKSSEEIAVRLPLLAPNAVLEGLYPIEEMLLEAMSSRNLRKYADRLRKNLSSRNSFPDRRAYVIAVLGNLEADLKELSDKGLANERVRDFLLDTYRFYALRLDIFYGVSPNRDYPGRYDPNAATASEKRNLGIPLTEQEKKESGLSDLTIEQKRRQFVPLTLDEFQSLEDG